MTMDRKEYENDLRERQRKHWEEVRRRRDGAFVPCAHNQCVQCVGTGIRLDSTPCVHYISCSCPKCSGRARFGSVKEFAAFPESDDAYRKLLDALRKGIVGTVKPPAHNHMPDGRRRESCTACMALM